MRELDQTARRCQKHHFGMNSEPGVIRARLLGIGWPQPCAHVFGPLCLLHRNGDHIIAVVRRDSLIAANGKHGPRKTSFGEDGARSETQRPV